MATLTLNGYRLQIRFVEVELKNLRLDPANPRLHSSYLTHELPASPSQAQLVRILEQLPEFDSLKEALVRNQGCFQPPLVTNDNRVLEGNRRVAAMRRLLSENKKSGQWSTVTVQQLAKKITDAQEKAIRAKFHIEGMLSWDSLSKLTEYLAIADRDGVDSLAGMLSRPPKQLEPLLVAGRSIRLFSQAYPNLKSQDLLLVLAGLCGVKQIEPNLVISTSQRCIYTHIDDERPTHQTFPLAQIMRWLAEGRFTASYNDGTRNHTIKPSKVASEFRRVREEGHEAMLHFTEPEGSLTKALAFIEAKHPTLHWRHTQALKQTLKFMGLLNQMKPIKRDENPELHVQATACYHRLAQLLGIHQR